MGAALCSSDYGERSFDEVLDRLEKSVDSVGLVDTMPPLFDSQEEYDAFLARHNAMHPPRWTYTPTPAPPGWALTPAPPPPKSR